jgi:hypothetical protein
MSHSKAECHIFLSHIEVVCHLQKRNHDLKPIRVHTISSNSISCKEANASYIGSDHLISIIAGKIEGLVSISTEENNILESFKAQSHIL